MDTRPPFRRIVALQIVYAWLLVVAHAMIPTSLEAAEPRIPIAVGVAEIDITPGQPIRLSGYASRREPATEVTQRLRAKALVLGSDEQQPAVLVTLDAIGIPRWWNVWLNGAQSIGPIWRYAPRIRMPRRRCRACCRTCLWARWRRVTRRRLMPIRTRYWINRNAWRCRPWKVLNRPIWIGDRDGWALRPTAAS